jgi:hypothetical protein
LYFDKPLKIWNVDGSDIRSAMNVVSAKLFHSLVFEITKEKSMILIGKRPKIVYDPIKKPIYTPYRTEKNTL